MNIALVNKYYPPDPAITGQSLFELANFVRGIIPDADMKVFATSGEYLGGISRGIPEIERVTRIKSIYYGRSKPVRFISNFYDGRRLADIVTRNADVVISMTDPPLINYWMSRYAMKRRIRWIEWTMDIYPHAFKAGGLVSGNNIVYKHFIARYAKRLPDAYICLGSHQWRFLREAYGCAVPAFIIPSGVIEKDDSDCSVPEWRKQFAERLVFAYAGNLGEAHSVETLVDLVDQTEKAGIAWVFAPYGAKADELKKRLVSRQSVIFKDMMSHAELSHADLHMVSLLPKWTDICVPSKAISAICLGKPILFAGSEQSDIWQMLGRAGWLIPENGTVAQKDQAVKSFLDDICNKEIRAQKIKAARSIGEELRTSRLKAFNDVANWIKNV